MPAVLKFASRAFLRKQNVDAALKHTKAAVETRPQFEWYHGYYSSHARAWGDFLWR